MLVMAIADTATMTVLLVACYVPIRRNCCTGLLSVAFAFVWCGATQAKQQAACVGCSRGLISPAYHLGAHVWGVNDPHERGCPAEPPLQTTRLR
jgi:hypothetical protein